MAEGKEDRIAARVIAFAERHWVGIVIALWLAFVAYGLFARWADINAFNLKDTDDNLRLMQVRALLAGQDWFDLRQYRMNPPFGANVHWSHLVDLPIAGLILLLKPLLGGAEAERWAVAVAPLIPLLAMFFAIAVTVRRLVAPAAYPIALITLFYAGSTMGAFMPMRIDHHGWQLAFLAWGLAGLADPQRRRGGIVLGVASALSLAIGLEMLIYLALMGAAATLLWVHDRDQRPRLATYGISLGAGTGLGFLLFASYANRAAVCDALSPVWMSDMVLAGALLTGIAMLSPGDWKRRFLLAALAGVAVAAFHGIAWPQCLTRLEGVSPEVERVWLSHVREARPVYRHGWRIATYVLAVPLTGLVGWAVLAWWKRRDPDVFPRILAVALPGIAATLLLFWQARTGPAAQLCATIGAAALAWLLVPMTWKSPKPLVRVLGTFLIFLAAIGSLVPLLLENVFPAAPANDSRKAVSRANFLCNSMWGMKAVNQQPKGRVLTFVDLGPRLIAITHHDAVTGPYHRNGEQIADVMHAWRGSEEQAYRVAKKYRSDYLLVCPDMSSATIFRSETPKGFYVQLEKGQVPGWLQPVDLGKDSPFRMWKVVG